MGLKNRQKQLGNIGESIVFDYLKSQGFYVVPSSDYYDNKKDCVYYKNQTEKITAEVKTQQPFVMNDWFSFEETQLRKCTRVDELYIVSVPPLVRPNYKYGGKIFRLRPRTKPFKYKGYQTKYGRKMIGIPIMQDAVEYMTEIPKKKIQEMLIYTDSSYK